MLMDPLPAARRTNGGGGGAMLVVGPNGTVMTPHPPSAPQNHPPVPPFRGGFSPAPMHNNSGSLPSVRQQQQHPSGPPGDWRAMPHPSPSPQHQLAPNMYASGNGGHMMMSNQASPLPSGSVNSSGLGAPSMMLQHHPVQSPGAYSSNSSRGGGPNGSWPGPHPPSRGQAPPPPPSVNTSLLSTRNAHQNVPTPLPPRPPQQQQRQPPQQQQQQQQQSRGRGRGPHVKPATRGPQPTSVEPTRLLDGRRIRDVEKRQQQIAEAQRGPHAFNGPTKGSPTAASRPPKPPRREDEVRKIKTTVGNDDTWMKGLTYSTWVDSPRGTLNDLDREGPYKRQPGGNKRGQQSKDKQSRRRRDNKDTSSEGSRNGKSNSLLDALRNLFR